MKDTSARTAAKGDAGQSIYRGIVGKGTGSYKLFSPHVLCLVLVGILVNYLGAFLADWMGAPLFLDTIGTILTAALAGALPGVIVGFCSNLVNSIADPISTYYAILSIFIALFAAYFSRLGYFRRLGTTLLTALAFALIGGAFGSLLTWLLYGFDFGTGVSAPLAVALYATGGMSKFLAQFIADVGIDIVDKLVTVIIIFLFLRFLPKKLFDFFPLGFIYTESYGTVRPISHPWRFTDAIKDPFRLYRRASLRYRIGAVIIIGSIVLSLAAVTINFFLYKKALTDHYVEVGENTLTLVDDVIDEQLVDAWVSEDMDAAGNESLRAAWVEARDQLTRILESMDDIEYLYVYQIREDGCHVVFDLDTAEVAGEPPGTVVAFDEAFIEELPALLSGQPIGAVEAHGQYGWLLSVYRPLLDSDGVCVAYAAVDYQMSDVVEDRRTFIVKVITLLFGVTIVFVILALLFAEKRIVHPLNILADATEEFTYNVQSERDHSTSKIAALNIRTGDEIENLYEAISTMSEEVSEYIDLLADKAHEIATMQDNTILSFATMIESRDENTGGHVHRTAHYVELIGTALLQNGDYPEVLDAEYLAGMVQSAPLHDVGKIKVPDAILNKPGSLTAEEYKVIKTHPSEGAKTLEGIFVGVSGENRLSQAVDMAHYHHERWDGNGYPEGLAGTAIPLCARVMAVADVFDALISQRSYKEPFSFDEACAIIEDSSGTVFDPVVVQAFLRAKSGLAQPS